MSSQKVSALLDELRDRNAPTCLYQHTDSQKLLREVLDYWMRHSTAQNVAIELAGNNAHSSVASPSKSGKDPGL